MSEPAAVGVRDEIPAFFLSGDETLFGIFAEPRDTTDTAVIALTGAGQPITAGRHTFATRVCRRVTAEGYAAMRFDFRGTGESTGRAAFRLARPHVRDVQAAARWIEAQGVSRFVLVGFCYGAAAALAAATEVDGVRGVVLLAMPIREYDWRKVQQLAEQEGFLQLLRRGLRPQTLRRLLDQNHRRTYAKIARAAVSRKRGGDGGTGPAGGERQWTNRAFLSQLEAVVERGIPILIVYGDRDEYREDFELARAGRLGEILERASPTIEVVTVRGQVHAFPQQALYDELLDLVTRWLDRLPGAPCPASA